VNENQEVLNNDNEIVARVMIHNVGDGVQILLVYSQGAAKSIAFITGTNVSKTITIGLKRRAGGRVAQVKK
jgi:hypothetical protein